MSDACQCNQHDQLEETTGENDSESNSTENSDGKPSVTITTEFGEVKLEGDSDDDLDDMMDTAVDGVEEVLEKHSNLLDRELEQQNKLAAVRTGAQVEILQTQIEGQKEIIELHNQMETDRSYHG